MQTTLSNVPSRSQPLDETKAPPLSVPSALRSAFDFMLVIDSRQSEQVVVGHAVSFLHHARAVMADPHGTFTSLLLNYCLEVRFPRFHNKASDKQSGLKSSTSKHPTPFTQAQLEERKPAEFPQNMWNGLVSTGLIQLYRSPHGKLDQDEKGAKAFQRDYVSYVDSMIADIERTQTLSESQIRVVNQIAGNMAFIYGEKFIRPVTKKSSPASELARLIKKAQPASPALDKFYISILSVQEQLKLGDATRILLKERKNSGESLNPELEASIVEWGKSGKAFELTAISQGERDSLLECSRAAMNQLLKSEIGTNLELAWMASVQAAQKDLEYLRDINDVDPSDSSRPPTYPPENYRFVRVVRATMRELNDLKRMSEFLEKEKLTGLQVEMDQSPFVWPRIAEAVLATKPSSLTLHSPTATQPFGSQNIAEVQPYLCLRYEHHLPLTLTTAPRTILEHDVNLARHATIEWQSPSSGTALLTDKTVTFSIDGKTGISNEVRARLGNAKVTTSCLVIKEPHAAPSDAPLAFATFFTQNIREVPGYSCHSFGKTVQLYVAHDRKPAPSSQPERASVVEAQQMAPLTSEVPAIALPPAAPPTQPVAAKKVRKEPTPPPVRDPRPKISEDQALAAKVIVAALPEVQNIARSSKALTPVVPFKESEISTALNILKNGERPGSKALKALRHYVNDDANFKDCLHGARTVREDLKSLLAGLLD